MPFKSLHTFPRLGVPYLRVVVVAVAVVVVVVAMVVMVVAVVCTHSPDSASQKLALLSQEAVRTLLESGEKTAECTPLAGPSKVCTHPPDAESHTWWWWWWWWRWRWW